MSTSMLLHACAEFITEVDQWVDTGKCCKNYTTFRDMVTKGYCDQNHHLFKYFCHSTGEKVMDFDGTSTVYTQYTYQCKSHGDMNRKGQNFCQAEVVMLLHMIQINDHDMHFRSKA